MKKARVNCTLVEKVTFGTRRGGGVRCICKIETKREDKINGGKGNTQDKWGGG